jgi:uncharacterized protein (TIGR00106 family)
LAIVDVTIIPIGTVGPSVSNYVANMQKFLEENKEKYNITYQLTPMSTLIQGDLDDLFAVVRALHELPYEKGIDRVATNIRIDDRRDKEATLESKLESVQKKIHQ